jgi:predicted methyltransferase
MKTVILVGVAAVAFTAFAAQSATMAKADVAAAIADPSRPEKDRALDASRKPAEILAAIGIRRGQTVADVWPGAYWDRLFADAVGPKGRVYAVHLSEADKAEHVETPAAGSAP